MKHVGFGPAVKERGSCNLLPASIVTFTVIFVMMQVATDVTRATDCVAVVEDTNGIRKPAAWVCM